MMEYLVILLHDNAVAYCHNTPKVAHSQAMNAETLKRGIRYAMQQNLSIQFIYPEQELSEEVNELVETIDHTKTKAYANCKGADVVVIDNIEQWNSVEGIAVLRTSLKDLPKVTAYLKSHQPKQRLVLSYTDIVGATQAMLNQYKVDLDALVDELQIQYAAGNQVQINVLTDRLQLTEMHNCGAGVNQLTLAPNGKFYLCPAFYYDELNEVDDQMNHTKHTHNYAVGDLENGVDIPNKQLLQLDHAPLCRMCDAYQCHRCIWMNRHTTWNANTPSHEQCVVVHLERNASRQLLEKLHILGVKFPNEEIKEIDYLDPFDVREQH